MKKDVYSTEKLYSMLLVLSKLRFELPKTYKINMLNIYILAVVVGPFLFFSVFIRKPFRVLHTITFIQPNLRNHSMLVLNTKVIIAGKLDLCCNCTSKPWELIGFITCIIKKKKKKFHKHLEYFKSNSESSDRLLTHTKGFIGIYFKCQVSED